jgi:hypothetical protein
LQGSQLVAEGKILKDHVVVAPAGQADRPEQQQHQFEHGLILSGMAGGFNRLSGALRFWRTTLRIRHSQRRVCAQRAAMRRLRK